MINTNTSAEIKITAMDNDTMIGLTGKGEPWVLQIEHWGDSYMITTDITAGSGYQQRRRGFLPARSNSMAAISYSNGLIPPPMIGDINSYDAIGRDLWWQLDCVGAIIIRIPRLRWYLIIAPIDSTLGGLIVDPTTDSIRACELCQSERDGETCICAPRSDWQESPAYDLLAAIATTALQHKLLVPGRRCWGEERREMGLRAALRHHGF